VCVREREREREVAKVLTRTVELLMITMMMM
jgi:hypothetical protein